MQSLDLLSCTVQKLKGQVTTLKASRDKLLAEVDRQSTEIERLLTHNAVLEQVSFSPFGCFAGVFLYSVLCDAAFISAG